MYFITLRTTQSPLYIHVSTCSSSHSFVVYHITDDDSTSQPVSQVGDEQSEDKYLREESPLWIQEAPPSEQSEDRVEKILPKTSTTSGTYTIIIYLS